MEILTDNQYPYGMTLGGLDYCSTLYNDYLYQGKELQKDGLDLQGSDDEVDTKLLWHDFHARFYDAQTGRFHVPDPIINEASPYVGMMNNPVTIIDPNGMAPRGFWRWVVRLFGGDDRSSGAEQNKKFREEGRGISFEYSYGSGSGSNSINEPGGWTVNYFGGSSAIVPGSNLNEDLDPSSGGGSGGGFYTSSAGGGGPYFWLIALGIDVNWYQSEVRKGLVRKEIYKMKTLIAKTVCINQSSIEAPPKRQFSLSVCLADEGVIDWEPPKAAYDKVNYNNKYADIVQGLEDKTYKWNHCHPTKSQI